MSGARLSELRAQQGPNNTTGPLQTPIPKPEHRRNHTEQPTSRPSTAEQHVHHIDISTVRRQGQTRAKTPHIPSPQSSAELKRIMGLKRQIKPGHPANKPKSKNTARPTAKPTKANSKQTQLTEGQTITSAHAAEPTNPAPASSGKQKNKRPKTDQKRHHLRDSTGIAQDNWKPAHSRQAPGKQATCT